MDETILAIAKNELKHGGPHVHFLAFIFFNLLGILLFHFVFRIFDRNLGKNHPYQGKDVEKYLPLHANTGRDAGRKPHGQGFPECPLVHQGADGKPFSQSAPHYGDLFHCPSVFFPD